MQLSSLSRFFLFALPLFLIISGCDTVGEVPAVNNNAGATLSSDSISIVVTPSPAEVGETVSLSLELPPSYDVGDAVPEWTSEDGTLLGVGRSVEHVFREPGEYGVSVSGLPDELIVKRAVPIVRDRAE
jgi:hypothetical protein